MKDLIGKYNRNRKKIWSIIGITVAIYVMIHIINNYLGQSLYDESNVIISYNDDNMYKTNYSVISDYQEDENVNKENINVIKEFINYCNQGNVEEAYRLLSLDCKEAVCPTIDDFKNGYYNENFMQTKTYKLQLWISNDTRYTYRVELINDMLATGGKTNIRKVDYYTITKDGEKCELSIDGFIEKNEINKAEENEYITINIKTEEIFVEYVKLNVEIKNKTQEQILLDKGTKGDSVYIKDTKDIAYASYLFEEIEDSLIVDRNIQKDIKIKFNKEYSENVKIKEVGFTDIVINYKKEEERKELIIEL